jgi:hypothetical protein
VVFTRAAPFRAMRFEVTRRETFPRHPIRPQGPVSG